MSSKLNYLFILFTFVILTTSCSPLYSKLGGDVQGPPEALQGLLPPLAKNLIATAYADIDPSRLVDFHTMPFQLVDATHALKRSVGVSYSNVLRGRSFNWRATALSFA